MDYDTSSLPNAVQSNLEAFAQLRDNAKVADMMVKTNPDLPQRMGFAGPEQFSTLSAKDKVAAVTGYMKGQGIKEFLLRQQQQQQQADQQQQQTTDDQTVGTFLQNYLATPTNPNGQALTPQERMAAAAAKTPGLNGRIMPRVIDSLARWEQANTAANEGEAGPPQFTTDTNSVPGWALTGMKGSHQWQALPVPGAPNVQTVDDGQGGKVAVLSDPKGRMTQIRPAQPTLSDAELLKSYDKQEAAIHSDLLMAPADKAVALAKITTAREELLNRSPKGATPSAPAPSLPKVGQVVKGYRFKGGDPKAEASWEKVP